MDRCICCGGDRYNLKFYGQDRRAGTSPSWCVITFAAGIHGDNPVTLGLPPAWHSIMPAFGCVVVPGYKENGNLVNLKRRFYTRKKQTPL